MLLIILGFGGAGVQNAHAQDPAFNGPTWANAYQGSGIDQFTSVQQTSDGGYIVAGRTSSFSSSLTIINFWVLKLDSSGSVSWQKVYSGSFSYANSIEQTSDGGYVVAGVTALPGVSRAVWVLKLDSSGGILWQNAYQRPGGFGEEVANSVQETSDGGYIVAGATAVNGLGENFWVLKLDSSGNIQWQNTYGAPFNEDDVANSVQETSDGGYVVAGFMHSLPFNCPCPTRAWIIKLDPTGNPVWQNTYGGLSIDDEANSVQQTSDNGYIVAGSTRPDFWVFKLDLSGNILWQRIYRGPRGGAATSLQQTSDGGYVVAGITFSFGLPSGGAWLLNLDSFGNVMWQNTYSGPDIISGAPPTFSVDRTFDGGYVLAGGRWVLKLDSNGLVGQHCPHIGPSNATVVDTSATVVATTTVASPTSATPAPTNAPSTDSSATILIECVQEAPIGVSKFFTDSNLNPLPSDSKGNPMINVTLVHGKVVSTNPGHVLVWVNVTNTSGSSLQSIKLNETLPVDWVVSPAWMPIRGSVGAIHVFFVNTTSLAANPEITQRSTITVLTGNPETVQLAISNFTITVIGHPLMPGQSILLSVKLTYSLLGTGQSPNSYPRDYTDSAIAAAWTGPSFTASEFTGTASAFFTVYAKTLATRDIPA